MDYHGAAGGLAAKSAYPGTGQAGASLSLGLAQGNVIRPETGVESVISRLASILTRVHGASARADTAANSILGYVGEETVGVLSAPAAVPTTAVDYLAEVETALGKLERHLGRIT